jgi:hypothetical protein
VDQAAGIKKLHNICANLKNYNELTGKNCQIVYCSTFVYIEYKALHPLIRKRMDC